MKFTDVIGQEEAAKRLTGLVAEGRLPHALMLCGPEGSGKMALALAFASYLLCERHDGASDSCGECRQCKMAGKWEHPDLHFTFPTIKLPSMSAEHKPVSDDFASQWRQLLAGGSQAHKSARRAPRTRTFRGVSFTGSPTPRPTVSGGRWSLLPSTGSASNPASASRGDRIPVHMKSTTPENSTNPGRSRSAMSSPIIRHRPADTIHMAKGSMTPTKLLFYSQPAKRRFERLFRQDPSSFRG